MDDKRKPYNSADYSQRASREDIDRAIFEAMSPTAPCIICGEAVPLTFDDFRCKGSVTKVCEKCKAAVLAVRQNMEAVAEQGAILD